MVAMMKNSCRCIGLALGLLVSVGVSAASLWLPGIDAMLPTVPNAGLLGGAEAAAAAEALPVPVPLLLMSGLLFGLVAVLRARR